MPLVLVQALSGVAFLLAAILWPRDGQPVVFLAADGGLPVRLMLAEDWRVARIADVGPFSLILAHPESERARPQALFSAAGTMFSVALRATPPGPCDDSRPSRSIP